MKISKTLITEEEIENKISEIADEINEKYKGEELVVIGILKGAFIVISDLAKQLQIDVAFDFMSIKSYYGSESSGQVKIVKDLEYDISNKNVLIVEDIYDTGLTLLNLKKLLFDLKVGKNKTLKYSLQTPRHLNYTFLLVRSQV